MSHLNINKLLIKDNHKTLVDISFNIESSTALIGQSGSGKSLTLKSLLGLLPSKLELEEQINASFELNKKSIGFIPQNPFTSLSPLTKIKDQFFCDERVMKESIQKVGLEAFVLERFPSQLSGGQLQRVVMAMALSQDVKILLLDEPTTALDEKSKKIVLDLISKLKEELDLLILFVTHDINSIVDICDDIVIIKEGLIMESGKTQEVMSHPKTLYTQKLIESNFENKPFRT